MAMTLRLPDDLQAALRDTAEREHRSMQEVARIAIELYVTRRQQMRDTALARIVIEDENLLDRLGKA